MPPSPAHSPLRASARLLDSTVHRHDDDELTWVAAGHATIVIAGRPWLLDTGHALVIPADVEHTVLPRPDSLVFPLLFGRGELSSSPVLIRRSPALDACARVLLQPGLASAESIDAARLTVRDLVPGSLSADRPPLPTDERARRVAEAILDQPALDVGIEEWARFAHTSSKTLQRCFRKDTGLTFRQWRQSARLTAAARRIERGDPVTTVANAVGYTSTSAFIDAFRSRYGTSPSRYRRGVV